MSLNDFCDVYKNTHSLESFPTAAHREIITIADADHSDSMFARTIAPPPVNNDLEAIKNTIVSVLITAWSKYTEQQQKNKIALELKKLSASFFTEQATEQSVIEVDQEPAADKVELKALIRQETKAETKSLEQKLDELTKQITALTNANSKNSHTGGRQQQGAPPNQRNTTRDPWWQKPPSDRNSNNNNNTNPSQTVTLGRSSNDRSPPDTTRRDNNNNNNNYYGPTPNTSGTQNSRGNGNDQADDSNNASTHDDRNSRNSNGPRRSNMRNTQSRGRQNRPSNTSNTP